MRLRVATLDELPEGKGTSVQIGNELIVLFRQGARVYALRDRCPHAGAPLNIGHLQGTELTCAWHGWMFDVTTGESIPNNPAFDVTTYPVTIEGNAVWLDIPHSALPTEQRTP